SSVPKHIAVIMDGNGRWAKERGLPRSEGHRAGAESVREIVESCNVLGVEFLTLYAFSSENWQRPQAEVNALMELLAEYLDAKTPELMEQDVRLRTIGRTEDLPPSCRAKLDRSMEITSKNLGTTLILALSYGGREEILQAVRRIAKDAERGTVEPETLRMDEFSKYLYTADFPDPDLMIRTSGEMRLSNFLLWQLSYAEIVVLKKCWPDFDETDFVAAIEEFSSRQRRYGGLSTEGNAEVI
ncbi:MAG: isoprenyl transferase, partial [Verrucomicrobiota bacterium]